MTQNIRSFIACPLPENVIESLSAIQEELKKKRFSVRWVNPENIHLTIKFLGDIQQDRVSDLSGCLNETAMQFRQFPVSLKGLGVFPTIRRPGVIWAGIGGNVEGLMEMQKQVEAVLAEMGFPKEEKKFKAHLTLGRIKERIDPKALLKAFEECEALDAQQDFLLDRLVLYRSRLTPGGAIYSQLSQSSFSR